MASADDYERNELDALRLENDTLRRNLGRLEEKIRNAEKHHASRKQTCADETVAEKGATKELQQLDEILQWLHVSVDGQGNLGEKVD